MIFAPDPTRISFPDHHAARPAPTLPVPLRRPPPAGSGESRRAPAARRGLDNGPASPAAPEGRLIDRTPTTDNCYRYLLQRARAVSSLFHTASTDRKARTGVLWRHAPRAVLERRRLTEDCEAFGRASVPLPFCCHSAGCSGVPESLRGHSVRFESRSLIIALEAASAAVLAGFGHIRFAESCERELCPLKAETRVEWPQIGRRRRRGRRHRRGLPRSDTLAAVVAAAGPRAMKSATTGLWHSGSPTGTNEAARVAPEFW